MKLKLINIFLYFFSSISMACTCVEKLPTNKAIDEADIVITGKIISKENLTKKDGQLSEYISQHVKFKVLVKTKHKGKIRENVITIVTGPALGGDCGFAFQKGETYTIYASYYRIIKNKKEVNKFLMTSICSRTDKLNAKEFKKINRYCKSKGYC